MSETLARAAITAALAAAKTAFTEFPLEVEGENWGCVDQVEQVEPYVKLEVDFLSADQADMADNPLIKQWGQIVLSVVVKEGAGTSKLALVRDHLARHFSLQRLGIVQCLAAERYKAQTIKGLVHYPLLVNFWYHSHVM